jgi:hypothetical protein
MSAVGLELPLSSAAVVKVLGVDQPSGVHNADRVAYGAMRCSTALYRASAIARSAHGRARKLRPGYHRRNRTHRHRCQFTCRTSTGAPARATIQN